jgi:hypothetical protein
MKKARLALLAAAVLVFALIPTIATAANGDQGLNMTLIGRHDLDGPERGGKGGEGMAMATAPDGTRILYVTAATGPVCFSVVDVTNPSNPVLLSQVKVPAPPVRCSSLDVSGWFKPYSEPEKTLAVANEVSQAGLAPAGVRFYDVIDPVHPREVGFFDTSGPHSRGVHHVWFEDGYFAYLSTGAADFVPSNQKDDQFLMIVDAQDPAHPAELGRWWYPGTRVGDPVPPPPRHPQIDSGYRLSNVAVLPFRPDRAYLGYTDGGLVILDISDSAKPQAVVVGGYDPPASVGFTHTVTALFSRDLLVVSSMSVRDHCEDAPKQVWLWDFSDETAPAPLTTMPDPADVDQLCQRGGRFGAHNVWENRPVSLGWQSQALTLGSFFNGGVRLYDTCELASPKEVAYYVPGAPPGSAAGAIQINGIYWDDRGIVYAVDGLVGGLYAFEVHPDVLYKHDCLPPPLPRG